MKINKRLITLAAFMTILSGSVVSCGKIEGEEISDSSISRVNPMDLEELPRGEYEVADIDYLSGIKNITDITPLNNNRFLITTDTSEYGDAESQRLYVADDTNSSITEITPDLDLGVTAYYSAIGAEDGRIFIAAVEPVYKGGKDPGHDVEENFAQDHIDFLFSKAKKINYKLFELNDKGNVISENKLDIESDPDLPVSWLVCNDFWDNNIVITATAVNNGDDKVTYYVVNENGKIEGQIENYIPYRGPDVIQSASDGRFCLAGTDFYSEGDYEITYFYDKGNSESSESFSVKGEDLGCNKGISIFFAGTFGHGDDLLYLSSTAGLFSCDKNGEFENIIDYSNLIPEVDIEVKSVLVLENNNIFILKRRNASEDERTIAKFVKADSDNHN